MPRVELQHPSRCRGCSGAIALLAEDGRAGVGVIWDAGRDLLGGCEGRDRLGAAGRLVQEEAKVVPSAVKARVAPHRLTEGEFGVRQLPGPGVGEGGVEGGVRVGGVELRGPSEGGRGLARAPELVEHNAQRVVEPGRVGIPRHSLSERSLGLGGAPAVEEILA